jgi:hypothetical protein
MRAARDFEREALAAPEGSLVVVGVPPRSWEWSVPFAAQPPFAGTDLTKRVSLVSPMLLHCCRSYWPAYTRRTLAAWSRRGHSTPVIVLAWDAETGALSRVTDREEPFLRSLMLRLSDVEGLDGLEGGIAGAIAAAAARDIEPAGPS